MGGRLEGRVITVFGGSRSGQAAERNEQVALELGRRLAEAGAVVCNGGGNAGLMRATLDGALAGKGRTLGVITNDFISKEEGYEEAFKEGDLIKVDDMATRKRLLYEHGDAFVALPGGLGTFEEAMEVLSWSQIGIHTKGLVMLSVGGYYRLFDELVKMSIKEGFSSEGAKDLYSVVATVDDAIRDLEAFFTTREAANSKAGD